jgi:hypothetical protein
MALRRPAVLTTRPAWENSGVSAITTTTAAAQPTLGEMLRHQRLTLRVKRLERVVAALEDRTGSSESPPAPLCHALADFRRELRDTRRAARLVARR